MPRVMGPLRVLILVVLPGALGGTVRSAEPPKNRVDADVLLRGGLLIDGTGATGRATDLAIKGDRIVAVGSFEASASARVIDVTGLIVAPGFIDLHSHSDESILRPRLRANQNFRAQGVTTIVTGNCGGGVLEVTKLLNEVDRRGAGTNLIHLIPLGAVRASVMGNSEKTPTERQFAQMEQLVEQGMKAGAWGVSTGLIYLPGRYASTTEIARLAKIAARHGGIYASHIRNESERLLESIDEALAVGSQAKIPVHISHLKASGKANWGLTKQACERIGRARGEGVPVSADQYPYVASSTRLAAMVIPHWAVQGTAEDFGRIADDPVRGQRLRREIQRELDQRDAGASIRIARYAPRPSRVGKDLVSIAREEAITPLDLVIDIQRHGGAQAISFGMSEDDVRDVMRHDFVATASDGSCHVPGSGDQPHPRSYGTFPRKIRYALDQKVLTLEAAIRSCTGLPAEILHLPDRGTIRVGAFADIVVFNPSTFRDVATFDRPTQYATGVAYLFINGVAAIDREHPVDVYPGRALRLYRDGPADTVFEVGRIWTGDRTRPWATALAIRGGSVAGVGDPAGMKRFQGPLTKVVSRPDAFGLPGLIDSHVHLSELGASLEEIDLRGVTSLDAVKRLIKERIQARGGDGWITGRNWDQSLWPGGEFPDAAVLDEVAPNRPVWLRRVDGHAGWANHEAMRRAGVDRNAQAPPDGQIHRNAQGEPSGVFIDGAMSLVGRAVPGPTKADLIRQYQAAQQVVLENGLTGVHDAGLSQLEIEALRELDRERKLKLRVYGMASLPEGRELAFLEARPLTAEKNSRFELRAVKLFIDGAMGSRGALLFEPYSDDPRNVGLPLIDPARLRDYTTAALKHGWQICTHAIGDKGNALVLDAYAEALKAVPTAADPRLRVEHAQVVRRSDIARFKSLALIASMQPSHASDDMRWADARLGPERVDGAYAWRWFLDAGIPLAFGSDFPVEIVNPFYGIYAALTRQDEKEQPPGGWHPDQRMSLDETLAAFTAGSAFAQFAETRLGVLREGYRADLTLVDRDLFKVTPRKLLDAKVVMTVIDGEPVFAAVPVH
ncbi:MAG: amidohydrolase family protein [Isosphaeraceae bacterium]